MTGQLGGAAAYITLGLVLYKLCYMLAHRKERQEAYAHMKDAAAELQALASGEGEQEEASEAADDAEEDAPREARPEAHAAERGEEQK